MLDKNLLFVTLPLLLVSGLALVKGIARLIAASRVDELAKLPLASGGTVDIREAGEVVLSLRGKDRQHGLRRGIVRLARRRRQGGAVTHDRGPFAALGPGRRNHPRRVPLRDPRRPAGYRLQASGCGPDRIDANNRLVLARPGGTPPILSVLWVVTAAVALLASLVFSAFSAFAQPAAAGVSVPAVGSPARTAILDAVRERAAPGQRRRQPVQGLPPADRRRLGLLRRQRDRPRRRVASGRRPI
jgi:hypothetical protein